MPWEHIEEIYLRTLRTETGRRVFFIPNRLWLTFYQRIWEFYRWALRHRDLENPYMQYFLGLHEFRQEPLVDPSMRKFGYYPEAISADKIYQTRANRSRPEYPGLECNPPAAPMAYSLFRVFHTVDCFSVDPNSVFRNRCPAMSVVSDIAKKLSGFPLKWVILMLY